MESNFKGNSFLTIESFSIEIALKIEKNKKKKLLRFQIEMNVIDS